MENSFVVYAKVKYKFTKWASNSTTWCLSREMKTLHPHKHLHTSVHVSIKSQKVKITQISINWWMNKQNMVYPYNEILSGNKKERNIDRYYNIDEPETLS